MAWEQRGNNLYYYRKVRNGGRVSSEYVGNGPLAQLLSDMDQDERQELDHARAHWKTQTQDITAMESDLNYLNQLTISLVRSTLLMSGYHSHKGQWRRKRNVE